MGLARLDDDLREVRCIHLSVDLSKEDREVPSVRSEDGRELTSNETASVSPSIWLKNGSTVDHWRTGEVSEMTMTLDLATMYGRWRQVNVGR